MKSIFILVLCMIPGIIRSQGISEKDVPAPVKKAFVKKYAQVETYGWSREHHDYLVEFVKEDLECIALFDQKGSWKYTQSPVDEESLPPMILDSVDENFNSPTILQAYLKELSIGGNIYILTVQEDTMEESENEDGEDEVYEGSSYVFEVVVNLDGEVIAKNPI